MRIPATENDFTIDPVVAENAVHEQCNFRGLLRHYGTKFYYINDQYYVMKLYDDDENDAKDYRKV